jgi:hypothetical protein
MNLRFVAAEVTRRIPLDANFFRLVTSAATRFRGSRRENGFWGNLSPSDPSDGERERLRPRAGPSPEGENSVKPPLARAEGRPKRQGPLGFRACEKKWVKRGWLVACRDRPVARSTRNAFFKVVFDPMISP